MASLTYASALRGGNEALPEYLTGAKLYNDVQHYSDLGEHRTATPGDWKTADWLAARLTDAGLRTTREPFTIPQFFLDRFRLEVAGKAVPAFPMWYPASTGPRPVTGHLQAVTGRESWPDLKGKIAFLEISYAGGSITPQTGQLEVIAKLAAAGAVGVAGVTAAPSGELMALNAQAGTNSLPIPVMLLGKRAADRLKDGQPASILIGGRLDTAATAYEVVGHLDRGGPLLVVSTPASGWFHCAGERGTGIALWLGLAKRAAERKNVSYIFVASSAHELDGRGVRSFLEHHAPKPPEVACWVHLGASIASYDWDLSTATPKRLPRVFAGTRLMCNRPDLLSLLRNTFSETAYKPEQVTDPPGELAFIFQQGYRALGFAGGHAYHHAPGDTADRTTGPNLLEPVARALARTFDSLESIALNNMALNKAQFPGITRRTETLS